MTGHQALFRGPGHRGRPGRSRRATLAAVLCSGLALVTACGGAQQQGSARSSGALDALGSAAAPPSVADAAVSTTTSPTSITSTAPSSSVPSTITTVKGAGALAGATLTPTGLGPLRIGMTVKDAKATGLLKPFEPGCPLKADTAQSALFVGPIAGSVSAVDGRIDGIQVSTRGVATDPGGVQVGDSLQSLKTAFEATGLTVTTIDGRPTFESIFARATRGSNPWFEADVDPGTKKVVSIATPAIEVCD